MDRRLIALLMLVVLVGAACSVARPSDTAPASPADSPAVETGAPGEPSGEPLQSEEPASEVPTEAPVTPTDVPTEPATPVPSEEPAAPAGADACTGTADNRDFLESVARDMDWTVLCAVLPKGWTVQAGSYRLANGGRMEMSYKSRSGATLALSEGAFCTQADGCVPPGADAGDAALGPLDGTLVALDDGGWAIVVDRGAELSWLLEAHGVDEATARSFGAALAEVEG